MGRVEDLSDVYERHIAAPWQRNLAGAQKVMFVVYPKEDERKLRAKRREFEVRTKVAGHTWREFDLTQLFAEWMSRDEYREAYFECPEDIEMKLDGEFMDYASLHLRSVLTAEDIDEDTVVGVFGSASLYGFCRLSLVLKKVEAEILGRLVFFFPGEYDQNNYRLLDARDGWNYLAVPITLHQGDDT